MSSIHTEIHFEDDIVANLSSHGWLAGDPGKYDAVRVETVN